MVLDTDFDALAQEFGLIKPPNSTDSGFLAGLDVSILKARSKVSAWCDPATVKLAPGQMDNGWVRCSANRPVWACWTQAAIETEGMEE